MDKPFKLEIQSLHFITFDVGNILEIKQTRNFVFPKHA